MTFAVVDPLTRECGGCTVCCEVAVVSELDKPAFTACRYQCDAGCSIYGKPERPEVCQTFECSWKRGVGREEDRPDLIGAMFSINETTPGKVIGFCVEVSPDAVKTTAQEMATTFVHQFPLPLVVGEYGKDTPGEWVIVQDDLRRPSARMRGVEVHRLADDVTMYELVI